MMIPHNMMSRAMLRHRREGDTLCEEQRASLPLNGTFALASRAPSTMRLDIKQFRRGASSSHHGVELP